MDISSNYLKHEYHNELTNENAMLINGQETDCKFKQTLITLYLLPVDEVGNHQAIQNGLEDNNNENENKNEDK